MILYTDNLSISYGKDIILHNVNISFRPCGITTIIGPSGCGKSTLLRSFNRMHDFDPAVKVEGKIMFDSYNINDSAYNSFQLRHSIGMVFQKPNPFFHMKISDNLLIGFKFRSIRLSKIEKETIVQSTLKKVNLWDEIKHKLKEPASKLSGGQQQRLCIARALVAKPKVLLLDEPCSALDPISTLTIEDLLMNLKKEITIIIVTHNMQQALRISDDTAFFYKIDSQK